MRWGKKNIRILSLIQKNILLNSYFIWYKVCVFLLFLLLLLLGQVKKWCVSLELPWFCTHWTKVGGWGEASCRVGFHAIGSVQWSCQGLETYSKPWFFGSSCSNRDAGWSPFSNSLSFSNSLFEFFGLVFFFLIWNPTWKRKGNMWESSELFFLPQFTWIFMDRSFSFTNFSGKFMGMLNLGPAIQRSVAGSRYLFHLRRLHTDWRVSWKVWVLSRFESYRFGRVDDKKHVIYIYVHIYIYICTYIYIKRKPYFLGNMCHFLPAPLRFLNVCLEDFFDEQISKDRLIDVVTWRARWVKGANMKLPISSESNLLKVYL